MRKLPLFFDFWKFRAAYALNNMAHHDFAHDFYLVNPFNVEKLSAALSCVLAIAGNWVDLMPETEENEHISFSDQILNQSYYHKKIISQKKIKRSPLL